ncbi:sigma-70 family RNA polymerase sigma factor [Pseudobacteroides cellulosolvens]|uniref:Putative RNA polymerase, sigma 70 family subunit n=1 Tax=Pseudobacteroides cellulosolvens ATCC 35603 = DSM 2933 TaxID=398512 RepID=A0A0L6JWI5_9FIRM|nr:sigma-70 family RNA polymerase sigma factor [Pseudobacteroides cellulosolvens]KNY30201.1 putative RNA polymerase, sigma 70 family subunit [Pseudobacteroides cellulosolvens ATCC 35603 = DSM 2933]
MECKFTNEELVMKYQNGDYKALEIISENNMGLIRHIASRYSVHCNYIDHNDLIQQGWTGLYRAVQTYKADMPNSAKFSTWAGYWIQQAIQRYLEQETPKTNETSLYEEIGEDITLEDCLEDPEALNNLWSYIERQDLRRELEKIMNERLSLKEREILKLRFGWNDNIQWDFRSIGKVFGNTGQNVHTSYKNALYKLRRSPWGQKRIAEHLVEKRLRCRNIPLSTILLEKLHQVQGYALKV